MGVRATQVFEGFTQSRFDCLVAKAAASGVPITGSSGQGSKNGLTIRWAFDAVTGRLELQCLDSPFWASCGMINSKMHDLVDTCP
jgi:hypothetical protein